MKVELSKDDKKQIDDQLKNNKIIQWFKHRENMKFEVGDVLLRYTEQYDEAADKYILKPEPISYGNKMPQRYVYIHEDKNGVGFIKKLRTSDGKLGKELFCLTDFDYSDTRFEVDPEYAEHSLLGEEFNIRDVHKKSLEGRKIIIKMNRKIGKKLPTLLDKNMFFDDLKKGDYFYTSRDYTGKYVAKYKVIKIELIDLTKNTHSFDWSLQNYVKGLTAKDPKFVHKVTYKGDYGQEDNYSFRIGGYKYVFYKTEPAKEEKSK